MLGSIEAFIIFFLSGLTFEFGDDLVCWARHATDNISMASCRRDTVRYVTALGTAHVYAAFAGTLVGYAVTPLSVVLSAFAGRAKSAGEAFSRGIGLELAEGTLSVIGQVITEPVLGAALWSLGLSAVIAPVRGGVAAFTYSWAHNPVFRFLLVVGVLGVVAIVLNRFGVLPI